MKLNVLSLGLAAGSVTAICVFLLGMVGWLFGLWTTAIDLTSMFYKGYGPTLTGSLIGAAWGFFDGFVGGALIAFFYNKFQKTS